MDARNRKEAARKRLIVLTVLCVVLPPIGMLLAWRGRYNNIGKLIFSALGTLSLMLLVMLGLSFRKPAEIVPTAMSATYIDAQSDAAAAASSGQTAEAPTDTVIDTSGEDTFVAPANPNQ